MLTSRCTPMSKPYFLGGFSTYLIGCCNLKTFDTLPSAAITNSMIRLHRCYWYRCYRFLSASLSVTLVHCAQTARQKISTRFNLHTTACLQTVLKFGLHIGQPTPVQILPRSGPPLLIWASETFDGNWQNVHRYSSNNMIAKGRDRERENEGLGYNDYNAHCTLNRPNSCSDRNVWRFYHKLWPNG